MKIFFSILILGILNHCQSTEDKQQVKASPSRTCLRGNCLSGFGVQQSDSDEIYSGNFQHSMFQGVGQITCMKSQEIISGNFEHGWIEGDFEIRSERMTAKGKVVAGKYDGLMRTIFNDKKQKFILEKNYRNGIIDGENSLSILPDNIQFKLKFKKGKMVSGVFIEKGVKKGAVTYAKNEINAKGKCFLIFSDKGREEKAEIDCIGSDHPEIFRGCSR